MRLSQTAFLLIVCALCRAQPQPLAFDVASVKPQPWTGDNGTVGVGVRGNTLYAEHATLNDLVEFAYDLQDFQLSGGPGWSTLTGKLADADLFQVIGKPTGGTAPSRGQLRLMLQTLLADRFHLQIHHVSKQLPTWNLVVAKGGTKLKESPADTAPHMAISSNIRIVATGTSIQRLIAQVSRYAGRPVFDKTGLTGNYDFTLDWVQRKLSAESDPGLSNGPSLFTAMQEQLDLKLESATAPFDTVVIDHAEKPSEN